MSSSLTPQDLTHILEVYEQHGRNLTRAAASLGWSRGKVEGRLRAAQNALKQVGVEPAKVDVKAPPDPNLQDRIFELESQMRGWKAASLTDEYVKRKIIGLKESADSAQAPGWVLDVPKGDGLPGVPVMMWSDWHAGEVVDRNQINGFNEYDLTIMERRIKRLVSTTIDLLRNHVVNPTYPGVVCNLGGDMMSGDIHEELSESNEKPMMMVLIDLLAILKWAIRQLADEFGKVFVPCVTGNHGRNTRKPRAKGRNFSNFDWLLYQFLSQAFEGDDRVTFFIPDGPDASYSVCGHRYLLTHGDQFRSNGDAQIGSLGAIIRGGKRKLTRNSGLGLDFDTMVIGHFHQYQALPNVIVNGCFPAGSLVTTDKGVTAIESVAVGDAVLSRDGSMQVVTNTFAKTSDAGLVHLKVRGLPVPLSATPNHLVWAIKSESKPNHTIGAKWDELIGGGDAPQWIAADFLSPGDFVHVPRHVGMEAPVDEETAWAYGLYLAEGSTLLDGGSSKRHNRIVLTMHEREVEVLRRFAKWFDTRYGTTSRVYIRVRGVVGSKTSEFAVSPGRDVCVDFREMFGHGAGGKRLPPGAMGWSPVLLRALIQGWLDGDGHTTSDGVTSGTTISADMAGQLFLAALSAGHRPSMTSLAAGGRRKNRSYTIHFNRGQESTIVNGELFYRVHARYRDRSVVPVYDLEVSGEHTYCVGFVGVHNSLKGYDEYASSMNFGFEIPIQALWMTHPRHGISMHFPVNLEDRSNVKAGAEWVTWSRPAVK